jgi:proteic killer suppression protein
MIKSFRDREAKGLFEGELSRKLPPEVQRSAYRKLKMLDAATSLLDLRSPWGNHLEPLHGDREGQYSVRINGQWRVCFRWEAGHAYDVEIVDYH